MEAEGWRKAKFGVWTEKGGGKRSLESKEGCRKTRLGVWRKRVGKRGLDHRERMPGIEGKGAGMRGLDGGGRMSCGGRVTENEAWSVEEGCRKTRLRVWKKGAGKRSLECGRRVPESEA